ncbi:MAG: NADH-quinone oxidoreductase subunit I [Deltaproteobacteria bacterium]|nr:NADH-quinone oxidoreductase subunit I [Deltaproteobacteria bacterium]
MTATTRAKTNYLVTVLGGLFSLLAGMLITLRNLFRRPVTEQYPKSKPALSKNFRSAIALVRFEETQTHDCVACMQCVQICPSFCIAIEGDKPEGLKRKRATEFHVDYALCSVCGLCIDVCPTNTLKYSRVYDQVAYRRDAFVYDLLTEFRDAEVAYLEKARQEAAAKEAAKQAAAAARANKDTAPAAANASKELEND